jgi:hypothetical protein
MITMHDNTQFETNVSSSLHINMAGFIQSRSITRYLKIHPEAKLKDEIYAKTLR